MWLFTVRLGDEQPLRISRSTAHRRSAPYLASAASARRAAPAQTRGLGGPRHHGVDEGDAHRRGRSSDSPRMTPSPACSISSAPASLVQSRAPRPRSASTTERSRRRWSHDHFTPGGSSRSWGCLGRRLRRAAKVHQDDVRGRVRSPRMASSPAACYRPPRLRDRVERIAIPSRTTRWSSATMTPDCTVSTSVPTARPRAAAGVPAVSCAPITRRARHPCQSIPPSATSLAARVVF